MDLSTLVIHPWSVHLPIGVLLAAIGFSVVGWYRRHAQIEGSGFYLIVVGWFALLPSVLTGTVDAVNRLNDPKTHPDALWWINLHGISAIALVGVVWSAWQMRRKLTHPVWESPRYQTYLWYLGVIFGIVLLSGWTGGHMVYALNIGRLPEQ